MIVNMRLVFIGLALLLAIFMSSASRADQFCYALAENYYQQLYCEVKASGKGAGLPSFYDFRRNDDLMQALLIKQFADRIGVKVVMPKPAAAHSQPVATITRNSYASLTMQDLAESCQRENNNIQCGEARYHLVGNKNNTQLAVTALDSENKMAMPIYQGAVTDSNAVAAYLNDSYHHYLQKMLTIGLGGSTLSYGKFAYLFADLNTKGVDFSERFETMYHYLKQDKKTLAVPAKNTAPKNLSLDDCYPLQQLLVCGVTKNNWIFKK